MTKFRTNRRHTNSSRLNHMHLLEATFPQLQSNNDQLPESKLSETTSSEPTTELSDNSSDAPNFKDIPTFESEEIGSYSAGPLILQSLLATEMADIDMDTVSCDSVGQLSSEWFNPQEYGCDSPV